MTTVLITGGAGFIGGHLVRHLLEKYPSYRLIVVDNLAYSASTRNLDLDKIVFVEANITDLDKMNQVFQEYKIEAVIHLAALTHVDRSFTEPLQFTQTNVIGTHVLLQVSKLFGVQLFMYVSTDEVYGESTQVNYSEEANLKPTNPYAASKAAAEHLVGSYAKSFQLKIKICRSNNVYGPGQYPEKLIPRSIGRLLKNKPWYHGFI